jgi:hypothetical protein
MFKDNFITVARAHHLALQTQRSYWASASKFIKWTRAKSAKELEDDPTGRFRKYLSAMANNGRQIEGDEGVSASSQNSAFHAIRFLYEKVLGIPLGDLSGIPKASGHERIVDVPPDDVAKRLVESVPGRSGEVLRVMYEECRRLPDVLRDECFSGLHDVTVQRNLARTLKRMRFRHNYTPASIHHAAARRISKEKGFLAAHRAIGSKTIKSTEWILGKKLLDRLVGGN